MEITPETVRWIFIDLFVLLISIALHEFGHAIMADKLGDDTPRRQGRVTLNPLAHADPIGTFLLPLVGGLHGAAGGRGGGFGWGKPVQWNPARINRKWKMGTAQILVAIAGPGMNFLLALVVATVHTVLVAKGVLHPGSDLNKVFGFTVITNFVLMFFNLLPIPPLDGGHVAQQMVPYRHRSKFDEVARFGPFIVLAFALIPQLAQVFVVPAKWCTSHLYSLLASLVM
ncbi:MAG: peptidase [Myxococcales bacterium]|nr:peptidase [Myxococcales bacterium]